MQREETAEALPKHHTDTPFMNNFVLLVHNEFDSFRRIR